MRTGEALVAGLAARGVERVFGIPGVHTIELYRGLARHGIAHVTARHEAGAGFMADGYARVSGRPGVAFVITGPGVTNILTPLGQARADGVPILVVSGVNETATLGRGLGHLHEMPDQHGLVARLVPSEHVAGPAGLAPALDRAFAHLAAGSPAHLQIPLDVLATEAAPAADPAPSATPPAADPAALAAAAARLARARRPVILAGGGCTRAEAALRAVAERLDAPVILTTNARGLLHAHPLAVPASPSLPAVRALIAEADATLAIGTELGPTDYDMYADGALPRFAGLVRIDRDPAALARHRCDLAIAADAAKALAALLPRLPEPSPGDGPSRAATALASARAALSPVMTERIAMLEAIRDALPGSIVVGDSTQPVYAGNLLYDHDRPGGWFNAATGFGALGYATGAAAGAALAAPGTAVVCLIGDGGLQFAPGEVMTAVDHRLPVTFLVWNNAGFAEIAEAMAEAGAPVLGCDPTPLRLEPFAAACGLPFASVACEPAAVAAALRAPGAGPRLVEVRATPGSP
jgi:acetolactate synthase I/II/III large subunit